MPPSLEIDPDIRRAKTPPASFYTDPSVFESLKRRAFGRSWQLIADADVVKAPFSVHPCPYLEGAIDEPLLLTRDADDTVQSTAVSLSRSTPPRLASRLQSVPRRTRITPRSSV